MDNLPTTLGALYKALRSTLSETSNADTADLDARLIIEKRSGNSYIEVLTDAEKKLSEESVQLISDDLYRRLKGEPLSKIYGEKEFWGRDFIVTTDVLDPRPDTESIIESMLEWYKTNESNYKKEPLRIADIGTGTGCIAITILCEIPTAQAIITDISPEALAIARKNAEKHKVLDRIEFRLGDCLEPLKDDSVDVVVTNPPYIPSADITNLSESVKTYDPILALDGGKDGLDPYKKIFISLKKNLRTNGRLFLECGFDQIQAINRIGENAGTTLERIIYDLGGHARGGEFSCGDKR